MAQDNNGSQLDLEEILKTLRSLPPLPQLPTLPAPDPQQQEQQQQYIPQNYDSSQSYPQAHYGTTNDHQQQHVNSSTSASTSFGRNASLDPRLQGRATPPQQRQVPPAQRTSTPIIDVSKSSTITEWKFGLRFVSKIAAQNPAFGTAVQKLIKDQERNIRDWNNGRERIVEEQIAKRDNELTQRAAISFLASAPLLRTPQRDKEELDQFYNKVYRACKQMTDAQSEELGRLGVPFFGMRPDLVIPDEDGPAEGGTLASDGASEKITRTQLLALKRKMLNHLIELYGD
ncbi:hypothetical protein BU24DRAFT_422458 [Aaosphaeria arxii CBS 175.79]|uniref:Uncharacterized protein n=1 Tax=Aaosphaeria arxii CBS 175.79 TaxID=1450172 RepID=A0A6A5XTY7_9PLEO|nr:uncharacterized protein BU24DRAFT_422458 [Aaosphaeria arxii CBS 175.79]KAF2016120.1 hypothetical protein BU24DRAFT_422458 [Aaosphaeria arxii CBS 175.79]